MTMIQITNKYGSCKVSVKAEDLDVTEMFEQWKGAMSGVGYVMRGYTLDEDNSN